MTRKKPKPDNGAEQVPPSRTRRRMLMTKADWEKVADANARAEKNPDPAQITLDEIAS